LRNELIGKPLQPLRENENRKLPERDLLANRLHKIMKRLFTTKS
jgi:hypothetical protein